MNQLIQHIIVQDQDGQNNNINIFKVTGGRNSFEMFIRYYDNFLSRVMKFFTYISMDIFNYYVCLKIIWFIKEGVTVHFIYKTSWNLFTFYHCPFEDDT